MNTLPSFVLPLLVVGLLIGAVLLIKSRRRKVADRTIDRAVEAVAASTPELPETKWKKIRKALALDESGKIWDEHKKAVVATFIGLVFFNIVLAYVEPFTAWSKELRETGWNFFFINATILFGVVMVASVGGSAGKILSRIALGLTAIALITFTWNYSKNNWDWSTTEKSDSTKTQTVAVAPQFTGPARDYPDFQGPERDSVMEFFSDNLLMADIAAAESNFHHWKKSVSRDSIRAGCDDVERNENNDGTYDLGVMQINSRHRERAESLGIDLCNLRDNMRFAELLIQQNPDGRDWESSAYKWRDHRLTKDVTLVAAKPTEMSFLATSNPESACATRSGNARIEWWLAREAYSRVLIVTESGEQYSVQTEVPPSGKYCFITASAADTVPIRIVISQ